MLCSHHLLGGEKPDGKGVLGCKTRKEMKKLTDR